MARRPSAILRAAGGRSFFLSLGGSVRISLGSAGTWRDSPRAWWGWTSIRADSRSRAALDALAIELFGEVPEWDLRRVNTLHLAVAGDLPTADVIVGNPPFGRVRLEDHEREFYKESLRGHANLYGLFLHVAIRMTSGLIGYVMPTSWLAGDYFGGLRRLLDTERPLRSLRFVGPRTGVFEGVLQEMCLAVFDGEADAGAEVFDGLDSKEARALAVAGSAPWLVGRRPEDDELVASAAIRGHLKVA